MKKVRSSGFGRLIGTAIIVSALLSALVGSATVASAQEDSDDSQSSETGVQRFLPGTDAEDGDEEPRMPGPHGGFGIIEDHHTDDDSSNENQSDDPSDEGQGDDAPDDERDEESPEPSHPEQDETNIDIDSISTSPAAGQSLADYIGLYGISVEDLISTLMAEIDAQLTLAVESGVLTQAQADELTASAEAHLDTFISQETGDDLEDLSIEQFLSAEVIAQVMGIDAAEIESAFAEHLPLADLALENGMSVDELIAALVADVESKVTDAVTNGEFTEDQADEILTDLESKVAELVGGDGHHGDDAEFDQSEISGLDSLDSIAELTGTTVEDLIAAVESGQSLADFAAEHGVSEADLVAAVVSEVEVQVTAAVDNGLLTQDEADMILAYAEEFVTSIVNAPNLMEIIGTTADDIDDTTDDECVPVPPNGAEGAQGTTPDKVCPAGS